VAPETDAGDREGLTEADTASVAGGTAFRTTIREHGLLFDVDLQAGQKTGFYLDQRESRRRVASYARGKTVLSCYCYSGAFEVHAAAAGASSIVGIDVSAAALQAARGHFSLNGLQTPVEYVEGDVPAVLRTFRDSRRSFDVIVLDPPRFVSSEAHKDKGMRAYKDINLLALKLLNPGGILATFSCSGLVSPEDLKTVLRWASYDAGRQVQILETLGQPPDHPILLSFPESEYLCGLICRV
jgi:23S rRNA (cytosine1962-C5)-methyltransferase